MHSSPELPGDGPDDLPEDIAAWLAEHELACRRTARRWIAHSAAVPVRVLRRLWPDPAWRQVLRGTIVGTRRDGVHGSPVTVAGLLVAVGEAPGAHTEILTLEGGTRRIADEHLVFAHHQDIPDPEAAGRVADEHGLRLWQVQLDSDGFPWRPHETLLAAQFDWVRDWQLRNALAPVGPATANALDAPGHPGEQAVRTRVHRHPALGERPVVRLLADTEAAGADLLASALGCPPPEVGPALLAAARHPLLGYPAWALVHDPDASGAALAGLKVLNEARRAAAGSPQTAFEKLRRHASGGALPASHAPAFWLEAATVFGQPGVPASPGADLARRCRALAVPPADRLRKDAGLWHALVRVGMVDGEEFCRDLAAREDPEAAHEAFREIALHRMTGAPRFRTLREFAVAAGRDGVEQDARDLGDIIKRQGSLYELPDVAFKGKRKAFVHLARTDDWCLRLLFGFRSQLEILAWHGLLEPLLADAEVAGRLRGGVLWPGSSATRWVNETYGREWGAWSAKVRQRLLDFLAPVLVEEGEGVAIEGGEWTDLNALDVLCEHGVPLAAPVRAISLTAWYRTGEDRRRPLEHVAADPRFRELLKAEVAAFDGAPEPAPPPRNQPPPAPFAREQLLEFPALAPVVAEVFPDLADAVGSPADPVLRRALQDFGVCLDGAPSGRLGTLRSMRAAAARLRGESAAPVPVPGVHWALLIEHVGAIAVRAVSPATSDEERRALADFLGVWAGMPFIAEPERGWQYGTLKHGTLTGTGLPEEVGEAVLLYRGDQGRSGTALGAAGDAVWFVRPTPRAGKPDPLHGRIGVLRDIDPGWATPERIGAFTRTLARRGPLTWGKPVQEAAGELAGELAPDHPDRIWTLTRADATLILAGFPGAAGGLSGERRKILKLRASEEPDAQGRLAVLDGPQRLRLAAAVPPPDPASWWRKDGWNGAAARVAAAWHGPDPGPAAFSPAATYDLMGFLYTHRPGAPHVDAKLATLGRPDRAAVLTTDGGHTFRWNRFQNRPELVPTAITAELEQVQLVAWAATRLPIGHPALRRLPELLRLLRERLEHPDVVIAATRRWRGTPHDSRGGGAPPKPEELFGPASRLPVVGGEVHDDGVFIAVPYPQAADPAPQVLFRPAALRAGGSTAARTALASTDPDFARWEALLELAFADDLERLAERAASSPVPDGEYEANPAFSAPELVEVVGAELSVSPDAAALYLQLAAMTDPTDRLVRRWNRWGAERHERAGRELLGAGAVLPRPEEKEEGRQLHGRSAVLPGALTECRAIGAPDKGGWVMEAYKRRLYPALEAPKGGVDLIMARGLVHRPPHELFALAWDEVRPA
ncbi:hypothetical protein [Actinomadura rugatobispora]|uniref:DUF4132 domain-containing protein n=1 Tax=Actinomadura rugatobispora TaxID=1994 RepID=A0ABW1AGW5_9ACTN|nr:hypothetical protein GCM10010200_085230 [Actinomadura rugatobispora]